MECSPHQSNLEWHAWILPPTCVCVDLKMVAMRLVCRQHQGEDKKKVELLIFLFYILTPKIQECVSV